MDYSKLKLPRPNAGGLLLAAALGIVVAIFVYQAQIRGMIPGSNLSLPKAPSLETKTIVDEESAVISVVEKTGVSVVAIEKGLLSFTGFILSGDQGLIVTNKHLVAESGIYTVVSKDGQKYEVRKIYKDPDFDLAILQIDSNNLKPLELGDSSKLRVGQTVIALGNGLGKSTNSATTGVVSAIGSDDLIQTDAFINSGNSGGPLLNSSGQVIGMNVSETTGAQNIGFALPINSVKQIVSDFSINGFVSRPYLGIQYKFISQGAYIQQVLTSSPADKAGLKPGDIILKINGQTIDSENIVSDIVSKANIGSELELTIYRGGRESIVKVILGESPNP